MTRLLDFWLGRFRWWRRLRGGRWSSVFHAPSMCGFWARDWRRLGSEVELEAEDYREPRAVARRHHKRCRDGRPCSCACSETSR